jgi:hypothetical protein
MKKKPAKTGRPMLGKVHRVLLTVSIDPRTHLAICKNATKYGSRGLVVDAAIQSLLKHS